MYSKMDEGTITIRDTADKAAETFEFAAVHPSISYPSYKSFDAFLDVDRLRSLDGYIRQRIKRHLLER
jgi:hypothetical protein